MRGARGFLRFGFTRTVVVAVLIAGGIVAAAPDAAASTPMAGGWSDPVSFTSVGAPTAVSCRTLSLCVAVDFAGNVHNYNDPNWAAPASIDPGKPLLSVSCATVGLHCAATDYFGNALIDTVRWSAPVNLGVGAPIPGVSCQYKNTGRVFLCVAVDQAGNAFTYNGTTWSLPAHIDPGGAFTAVSCATVTFCVAVDQAGNAFTFDGANWSAAVSFDPGGQPTTVSCATPTFCATMDGYGDAFTYDGTNWTNLGYVGTEYVTSISCPTSTFCAAVDSNGEALTYDGTAWSSPVSIDPLGLYLSSVSCPSARRCIAVDLAGNSLEYYGIPGGLVTLWKSSGLIGNQVINVKGTGWQIDRDTSVSIYECATATYSSTRCDTLNATTAPVGTSGTSRGTIKGGSIRLAVGVIDTAGDTCGLTSSPACYIVVVGSTGDSTGHAITFTAPTAKLSKSTGVAAGYTEKLTVKHMPIGDAVTAQQCDQNVTPSNLATNCDPGTAITQVAGNGGGFLYHPLVVTVRVGPAYSDAAAGTCNPGGTCYIVVNDTVNPALSLLLPISLAP